MLRDLVRRRVQDQGDDGFTLIAVVTFSLLVMLLTTALLGESVSQANDSQRQKRDDQLIAGAEAVIDRYASKLTINPQYYLQRVDESERARTCVQSGHAQINVEVQPGSDWISGCIEWAYLTDPTDADWFTHPLLVTEEDIESLIEITPPADDGGVEITVVGRIAARDHYRAISAEINAVSLSQFVRVTELDLRYGDGAVLTGKVYSGGNLSFEGTTSVAADIHSEGTLFNTSPYSCPTFLDGAEAYDSGSGNCSAGNVRDVFPEALAFSNFWDDLDRIVNVACGGSGLCLNHGYEAYIVHPYLSGGEGKLAIWGSDTNPPTHSGCTAEDEDSWWQLVHDASVTWTSIGSSVDYPANGVVWADGHVIVGNRGPNPSGTSGSTSVITGGLTILAGTQSDQKNLIYNAEVEYSDPDSFDIIGLIASDEFVINPYAVGSDLSLELRGAVLSQENKWLVSYYCGDDGSSVWYDTATGQPVEWGTTGSGYATLNVTGSIASPNTGNPSGSFSPRNYGFDSRLAYLRPPFYPLIGDDWSYENWSEDTIPSWAK
ncbi:MAG: hypothetical protein AAFZ07_17835 [Actinomycetota bacterium]